jgi:hypothetical protein
MLMLLPDGAKVLLLQMHLRLLLLVLGADLELLKLLSSNKRLHLATLVAF